MAPMAGFSPILQNMMRGRIPPKPKLARNGFSDPGTERKWQVDRSPTEYSQTRILPAHEVVRRLRGCMLKYCEDRSRRSPFTAIAGMADVTPKLLYLIVLGRRRLTESVRKRLSAVLLDIESGALRFFRRGWQWFSEYREPRDGRPSPLYPTPAPPPPPQDRMVGAVDYVDGARCRSCQGWRFSPVVIPGRSMVFVCDNCLPESQWPAIGAQRPRSTASQKGRSSL
jgi:hypothetical protein